MRTIVGAMVVGILLALAFLFGIKHGYSQPISPPVIVIPATVSPSPRTHAQIERWNP